MTIQQAKDDVAKIHGFDNFQECYFMGLETSTALLIKYCDEAAEKYAQSQVNDALDKAIEIVNKEMEYSVDGLEYKVTERIIEELKKLKR